MSRAPKGGRRRLDASVPPEYDLPTREPRLDSPVAARAIENTVYVVAAAQGGDRYTGHSLVVDPRGSIVGEADLPPEIIRVTLEPEVVARAREINPSLANRRIRTNS